MELGEFGSTGNSGGSLFVAEQDGRVFVFHAGEELVVLDLRSKVRREGNEEGLLSVAVDPAFGANGHLWVYYSVAGGARRTRLARFTVDPPGANAADPASELVVLEVEQPFANHNGGAIRFGPDSTLYLGLGDGGQGGDPFGNGQNRSTLLGTIIRIDVREASAAQPYAIPAGQPAARDGRRSARGVGVRLPQPVADGVRRGHGRAVGRRRRSGTGRGDRHRGARRQLRLEPPRGA